MKLLRLLEDMAEPKVNRFVYELGDIEIFPQTVTEAEDITSAKDPELEKFLQRKVIKNPETGRMVTIGYAADSEYVPVSVEKQAQRMIAQFKQQRRKKVMPSVKGVKIPPEPLAHTKYKELMSLVAQQRKLRNRLDVRVKRTLQEYTGDDVYGAINGSLRKKKPLNKPASRSGMFPGKTIADYVKELDSVFKRPETVLKRDLIVWRGMSKSVLSQLKMGGTFLDRGFVSTTTDIDTAGQFSSGFGEAPSAILRIVLPKGHRALHVESVVYSENPGEGEVLLPRNQKFKIVSKHVVDADEVGEVAEMYEDLVVITVVPVRT